MTIAPNDRPVAPERTLQVLLFLLPVLATVALYLPNGLLMPARVVTLASAMIAVWNAARTRNVAAPRTTVWVSCVGGLFIALAIVGILRYPDRTSTASFVQLGFILVTCLASSLATVSVRLARASVAGWLASALLAAIVGLWEAASGSHLPGNAPARKYADTIPGWNEISSFFDNPNLYAYHLGVVLLLLPAAWSLWAKKLRWVVVPAALALGYLLLETNGRMVMLAVTFGTAMWCLRFRWSRIVFACATIATGFTMILSLPPGRYITAFLDLTFDNIKWPGTSTWIRAEMARSGWWMSQQSDYLGVGPGGYAVWAFDPSNPFQYERLNNAHWGLVEVVAEYGAPGLIALCISLVAGGVVCLKAGHRLRRVSPDRHGERSLVYAGFVLASTLPILCMAHSTWLRQPLTAAHLGLLVTIVAYAELVTRRIDENDSLGTTING